MSRTKMAMALAATTVLGVAMAVPAHAAVVVLDFEGVGDLASVDDFYNGGTDSDGNSGVNYGIGFSNTSLGIIDQDAGGSGNFANEPTPNTVLFFLDGGAATMNIAAGFTTGFSFFYSGNATNFGSVVVYDALNAGGSILATLDLSPNGGNCTGDPNGYPFCQWDPFGVSFEGTAYSIDFGGVANQIGFDNVTFGSQDPGSGPTTPAVPEPSTWLMMLFGVFALGGALRQQRIRRGSLSVSYS